MLASLFSALIWFLIYAGLVITVIAGVFKAYLVLTLGICTSTNRMTGKTVIITGANTGIGKETALDLAKRGARVILACRNQKKAAIAKDEIIAESGNKNVLVRQLDLDSLKSVRKFATDILKSESRLDVLINNAGCAPVKKVMTEDGLEHAMQTNYLGHFLLTNLLLGLLKKSAPSRIVNVSSLAHRFAKDLDVKNLNGEISFNINYVYNNTKLCQILSAHHLAPLIADSGVTVNCLHPGAVETEIFRNVTGLIRAFLDFSCALFFKTSKEGAQTSIHLAVSDEVAGITGKYFSDCKETKASRLARDDELARKLWEASEKLVGLKPEERHF